jgi:hypothetical protein
MRRAPEDDRKAFGSETGCDKDKVSEDFSNALSDHARGRHLRHWRVLLDQILRFEILPELGGDLRLHGSVIRKDLLFGSAAHH